MAKRKGHCDGKNKRRKLSNKNRVGYMVDERRNSWYIIHRFYFHSDLISACLCEVWIQETFRRKSLNWTLNWIIFSKPVKLRLSEKVIEISGYSGIFQKKGGSNILTERAASLSAVSLSWIRKKIFYYLLTFYWEFIDQLTILSNLRFIIKVRR